VTAKLYLLCLLAYAAHTTFVLGRALFRLRHLPNHALSLETRRLETVRQANALFFLLFGIVFATEMLAMIRTIGYMSVSLSGATIGVFGPLVTFTFFAFVVFTFLHVFQWIVTAKL
jgi:hypothetical protein